MMLHSVRSLLLARAPQRPSQMLAVLLVRRTAATTVTNSSSISSDAACSISINQVAAPQQAPSKPGAAVQFYRRVLPPNCLAFGSPEGKQVFREAMEAGYMEGYFALASQYRTQDDPAFCGLATLVMCLNSLEVDPGKVWKGPWRWFHEEMLNCCVQVDRVREHGLTLAEFACLAGCNSLHVRRLVQPAAIAGGADAEADAAGLAEFEAAVRDCCSTDGRVLVASYSRRALGQTGDGHFAPIGGFHPGRQLVLIFDTARFKYPPHWVTLRELWESMKLPDSVTGRPRGYCVLAKARGLVAFRVSQEFATGVRAPDSPLLRLAHGFDDWLLDAAAAAAEDGAGAASAPANHSGAEAAVATMALAAGQLGRLCELHGPADFVLCRQRAAACPDADAVLSALRSLPAYASVTAEFCSAASADAAGDSDSAGDRGATALLALLAWPLPPPPALAGRAACLSEARDRLLSGAAECLLAEVQLLRNQLGTIFELSAVRRPPHRT